MYYSRCLRRVRKPYYGNWKPAAVVVDFNFMLRIHHAQPEAKSEYPG